MPPWTEAIGNHAEAERELTDHIETVVSRYRGAIPSWDVVNEPLAEWPENAFIVPPFDPGPETDWEPDCLSLRACDHGREADPDARLVLNEYDVEFKGPRFAARRKALVRLLRSLRDRDVPLHAVGLQAHLFAGRSIDGEGLQELLAEIAALKLDVLITELDVIDYRLPGKISERDAHGRQAWRAQFPRARSCEVTRPTSDPDLGPERSIHLGADLFQTPGRHAAESAAAAGCRAQTQPAIRRHQRISGTGPHNKSHRLPSSAITLELESTMLARL